MNSQLGGLIQQPDKFNYLNLPIFYRLKNSLAKEKFQKHLKDGANIIVFDEILGQVEELVKSKKSKVVHKGNEFATPVNHFLGTELCREDEEESSYLWTRIRNTHPFERKSLNFVVEQATCLVKESNY